MYRISVKDDTNLELTYRDAYRETDVEFAKHELKVLYPQCKIEVTEYEKRTKESAEKEIDEKRKQGE